MITLQKKGKLAKAIAATAAVAVAASTLLVTTGPASADPAPLLVGAGSDTTLDVMNGLSGLASGIQYPAVLSDSSPKQALVSYDALNPGGPLADGCITTKFKAGSFPRPNGSSSGQRAVSRSIDGGLWGPSTNSQVTCAEPPKPISNQVDWARSSSGPAATPGTGLQFIPFARDALSFAYLTPTGATTVTELSRAELQSMYNNPTPLTTPFTKNGTVILPCGIQQGSGTYASWLSMTQSTTANDTAATDVCNDIDTATDDAGTGRIQENHGNQLKDKVDLLATFDPDGAGPLPAGHFASAQLVIGFSAANYIAQSNGVVTSQLPAPLGTVKLGSIIEGANNLGVPIVGNAAAPPISPNAGFFANSVFGREVYNVLGHARIRGTSSIQLKELFISTGATAPGANQPGRGLPANFTAVICRPAAQTIVNTFGFSSITTPGRCGTVADGTLEAPLRSGSY